MLIAQGGLIPPSNHGISKKEFREHEVFHLPQPKGGTQMRARRIEFLETKAIQSAYQINPQRQSVRKEERTESVPLQIPQTTKLHVILNERSSKKRHAHFQTPSDLRGVLNQIFATTKTYSTRGFTHRNHSFKNNNQKRKLR